MAPVIFAETLSQLRSSCGLVFLVLPFIIAATIFLVFCGEYWRSHRETVAVKIPFIIGSLFVAVSIWGLWTHPEGSVHSISEAFLVAGCIVMVVDPLLKKRLLKEFATDLFPYMMGFELPLKIKERLREMISSTKLYRESMSMELYFPEQSSPSEVKIRFVTEFDLINPTSNSIDYTHHLAFEDAEQTESLTVTLQDVPLMPAPAAILERNPSGAYNYESDPIPIKPNLKSDGSDPKYHFKSQYLQTYPTTVFHLQRFGLPTIGFKLTLKESRPELEVMVTIPGGQEVKKSDNADANVAADGKKIVGDSTKCEKLQKGTSILYENVFMKGDSIDIRWRLSEDRVGVGPRAGAT
jgi:hypothetical protein